MAFVRLALLASLAASVTANVDYSLYEAFLEPLFNAVDEDNDGKLNLNELTAGCAMLQIQASAFTQHSGSISLLLDDLDANNDNAVAPSEFVKLLDYPAYKAMGIKAFANGAGAPDPNTITNLLTPGTELTEAEAKLEIGFTIDRPLKEILPKMRQDMLDYFANVANVPTTAVIITLVDQATSGRRLESMQAPPALGKPLIADALPKAIHQLRKLSEDKEALIKLLHTKVPKRRLQTVTTSVEVTIFTPTNAAADAAVAAIPTDPTTFGTAIGQPVSAAPSVKAKKEVDLPIPSVVIVGVVLMLLGFVMCFNAMFWSRKSSGQRGACCTNGCCSFHAVKAWAFSELIAAILILIFVIVLYAQIKDLTDVILALTDVVIALHVSSFQQARDLATKVPAQVIDVLRERRSQMELLPMSVMLPGILAFIFLLLGSLCPCLKKNPGSYVCTKCMIVLSHIFLILALVFYIIFAAFALAIKFAPQSLLTPKNLIEAVCATVPASIKQSVADNTGAVALLTSAGQDTTQYASALTEATDITTIIERGCDNIELFFDEMIALFLPGLLCVVAIVFAMFVNQTLCCAAGCCRKKPANWTSTYTTTKKIAPQPTPDALSAA